VQRIRVVTKSDCPFCKMAKGWLKEHAFEYEEQLIDNEEERSIRPSMVLQRLWVR
jgi:glutaredoxin